MNHQNFVSVFVRERDESKEEEPLGQSVPPKYPPKRKTETCKDTVKQSPPQSGQPNLHTQENIFAELRQEKTDLSLSSKDQFEEPNLTSFNLGVFGSSQYQAKHSDGSQVDYSLSESSRGPSTEGMQAPLLLNAHSLKEHSEGLFDFDLTKREPEQPEVQNDGQMHQSLSHQSSRHEESSHGGGSASDWKEDEQVVNSDIFVSTDKVFHKTGRYKRQLEEGYSDLHSYAEELLSSSQTKQIDFNFKGVNRKRNDLSICLEEYDNNFKGSSDSDYSQKKYQSESNENEKSSTIESILESQDITLSDDQEFFEAQNRRLDLLACDILEIKKQMQEHRLKKLKRKNLLIRNESRQTIQQIYRILKTLINGKASPQQNQHLQNCISHMALRQKADYIHSNSSAKKSSGQRTPKEIVNLLRNATAADMKDALTNKENSGQKGLKSNSYKKPLSLPNPLKNKKPLSVSNDQHKLQSQNKQLRNQNWGEVYRISSKINQSSIGANNSIKQQSEILRESKDLNRHVSDVLLQNQGAHLLNDNGESRTSEEQSGSFIEEIQSSSKQITLRDRSQNETIKVEVPQQIVDSFFARIQNEKLQRESVTSAKTFNQKQLGSDLLPDFQLFKGNSGNNQHLLFMSHIMHQPKHGVLDQRQHAKELGFLRLQQKLEKTKFVQKIKHISDQCFEQSMQKRGFYIAELPPFCRQIKDKITKGEHKKITQIKLGHEETLNFQKKSSEKSQSAKRIKFHKVPQGSCFKNSAHELKDNQLAKEELSIKQKMGCLSHRIEKQLAPASMQFSVEEKNTEFSGLDFQLYSDERGLQSVIYYEKRPKSFFNQKYKWVKFK